MSGYALKLFLDQEAAQECLCSLCKEVLNNPVNTGNGCEFCHACAISAIVTSPTKLLQCKNCQNEVITAESLHRNKRSRNIIEKLVVKCPNAECEVPCDWTGLVAGLALHVRECLSTQVDCDFFKAECCVEGCTGKVCTNDWESHQQIAIPHILNQLRELKTQAEKHSELNAQLKTAILQRQQEQVGYLLRKFDEGESTYCGESDDGRRRHGVGRLKFSDSHWYQGDWVADKMEGVGTLQSPDGNSYTGSFEGNVKQGHGVMLFSGGGKYDGHWGFDKMHGKGKCSLLETN